MSATKLLDQLDALHAAGTVGPWRTDEAHGRDISDEAYSWHAVVQPNDDEVATTWPVGHERHDPAADAALIVAAVNTLPQLTAALRAVLALHRPVPKYAGEDADVMACAVCFDDDEIPEDWPCRTYSALTGALSPAHPMSAEPGMSQP